MLLDLLFLIPLFIIGGICTFTDFRYGKIKNKWIVLGLIWIILLYLSLIFYTQQGDNIYYILQMLINGLIAALVGYFLCLRMVVRSTRNVRHPGKMCSPPDCSQD